LLYDRPTRVDATVLSELEKLVHLAPLHQPHNLAPIRALLSRAPQLPQVACFDTAFHRDQSEVEQALALPRSITDRGVRRYGFHGLSYEYISQVLPGYDPLVALGKIVILHLGNGSSMCAIANGRSVASTMGFTAVDGLPMGTRCGAIDPGVLLYLMNELGMDAQSIENTIYRQSGLLGVSGISSDMRVLESSSEPGAKAAIDLFVHRIGRELGALAAALGGLDGIVFTAGIGQNSALVRERVCRGAAWLGVDLDSAANTAGAARISTPQSAVGAWVIPTNEELMIAQHTAALLPATQSATAALETNWPPVLPTDRAANDADGARQP
jgi:acetate kinase